ncbi:hypothetical protein TWF192_004246 [Orbilia oligospora]|nr:hypothetical protein TWF192_004246 [Orbilia oligospora]
MALILILLAVAPILGLLQLLYTRYKPHLRRIPGPFVASFTNAWRLKANLGWRPEIIHGELHKKYGDLVRIGPNCVSVGSASEVKTIYGITRLFQKSKFYPVTRPIANGKEILGVFDVTSEELHKNLKRPIGHAYAMSTLLDYEPYVDSTVKVFQRRLEELLQEREKGDNSQRKDFLSRFLDAADKYEGKIPREQVIGWASANVFAGSDTTAISLRAIMYNLMKFPAALHALRTELSAAGLSSSTIPKYSQTNSLPYLSAIIKESLRLHPAVGILLERIVPAGGVTLCDKRVYGADAEFFRPERWIEASEEQKADMERSYLVFGSGKRTCIGKNISLLEIYKIVPWLVMRYDFELVRPDEGLKLHNSWFVGQTGLDVYITSRNGADCAV